MSDRSQSTDKEIKIAKEERDVLLEQFMHAQNRQNLMSDRYTSVQLQIAGMILSLGGITTGIILNYGNPSPEVVVLFGVSILLIIFSLGFGLTSFHKKGGFWSDIANIHRENFIEYQKVVRGQVTLDKADDHRKESMSGEKKTSPQWPWALQTTFLILGIICMLFSAFMYAYQQSVVEAKDAKINSNICIDQTNL